MRSTALLAVLLLLVACSSESAPPPFDAVVEFSIDGARDAQATTTKPCVAFVALEKTGKTPIVDTDPDGAGAGEQYGRHNFPPYCSAASVAAYFDGLLRNAGWTDADFRVEGARLSVFGVRAIRAGATGSEVLARVVRR